MKPRNSRSLTNLRVATGMIVLMVIAATLLAGEFYLRSTRRYASRPEGGNGKARLFRQKIQYEPWLWTHPPNYDLTDKNNEYTQVFSTNADGFVGAVLPAPKEAGEFRIIAVGDSFTAGEGDLENLGYPGRLARLLSAHSKKKRFSVMNAGVGGSDPVFELELLRRRLVKFNPDLVLFSINESDVVDLLMWGGLDRFGPDGFLKAKRPLVAPIFKISHLVRAVMINWLGYHWYMFPSAELRKRTTQTIQDLAESAVQANRFAAEHGFKVLVVLHPAWQDLVEHRPNPELQRVTAELRKREVDFADLYPDFVSLLPGGIPHDYYWRMDGHYTGKGYEIFAQAVEIELRKRGFLR